MLNRDEADSLVGDAHRQEQQEENEFGSGNSPVPEDPFGRIDMPVYGPDPWMRTAIQFLQDIKPFVSKGKGQERSTYEETRYKLKYIGRQLRRMKTEGYIRSTNPKTMNEHDILEFFMWMNKPPEPMEGTNAHAQMLRYKAMTETPRMSASTQKKYLSLLKQILLYSGNPVVLEMQARKRWPHLHTPRPEKRILTREEINAILESAKKIEGFDGAEIYHAVLVGYVTGSRPIEICRQEMRDLLLDHDPPLWRVSYAKGDQAGWGLHTPIPVPAWFVEQHKIYLSARKKYLESKGVNVEECPWLFPRIQRSKIQPISTAMLRNLKAEVERRSGVKFHLRDLRKTFGQEILLATKKLEATQAAMRHNKIETTNHNYVDVIGAFSSDVISAQTNRVPLGALEHRDKISTEPESRSKKSGDTGLSYAQTGFEVSLICAL